MPYVGRHREELSPRLRSLPVGNYVIFYRPMEDGIEVARVLHGARDLPPLFERGSSWGFIQSRPGAQWVTNETYVLTLPNWGVGSDHRPIVATFNGTAK